MAGTGKSLGQERSWPYLSFPGKVKAGQGSNLGLTSLDSFHGLSLVRVFLICLASGSGMIKVRNAED